MELINQNGKNLVVQRGVRVIRAEDGIDYDKMITELTINDKKTWVQLFTMGGSDQTEVYTVIKGEIYMVY